jgi:hypothetical protein
MAEAAGGEFWREFKPVAQVFRPGARGCGGAGGREARDADGAGCGRRGMRTARPGARATLRSGKRI